LILDFRFAIDSSMNIPDTYRPSPQRSNNYLANCFFKPKIGSALDRSSFG
jgi:hypothetical protein